MEEVRQLGIKKKGKEAHAREEREKAEYLKHIHDTIYACKTPRSEWSGEATHRTDANTNEVTHCVTKMHDWIMKAWMPLFRMYEFQAEPAWEAFRAEYENEFRRWIEACPQQIHEKGLET